MRKWLQIMFLLVLPVVCHGQNTIIKGKVSDAVTGSPLPFAKVFVEGTSFRAGCDSTGAYHLEFSDSTSALVLSAKAEGYEPQGFMIVTGSETEADFHLRPSSLSGADSLGTSASSRRIKEILARVEASKSKNNPAFRDQYSCDVYTKTWVGITDAERKFGFKIVRKTFGFLFDYMDTSAVTGTPYLPSMLAESVSKRYHSRNPLMDKEEMLASNISGLNSHNALRQFSGFSEISLNFYEPYLNASNINIPSPLSSSAGLFYNFALVDSLSTGTSKSYRISFTPKEFVTSPVFYGQMTIDAQDYALEHISAKIFNANSVNWIRDLVIESSSKRLDDGTWFPDTDNLFVDFSILSGSSSLLPTLIGNRKIIYTNPVDTIPKLAMSTDLKIATDAGSKDQAYWNTSRPEPLSKQEQGIYDMVDSVKNTNFYRFAYGLVNTISTGYYETKYIAFGPYSKLVSRNDLEDWRFGFGVKTTKDFSRKHRITLSGAYGTRDKKFKGSVKGEFTFDTQPFRKLTINWKYDYLQLGRGSSSFQREGDIFNSLVSRSGFNKRSMVRDLSILYEHEWKEGFDNSISLESMRVYPNHKVPMVTPQGELLKSVSTNQIHYSARLSWDETVSRTFYKKKYIFTRYPIVSFDLIAAPGGVTRDDFNFVRTEISMDYRLAIPPIGHSYIHLNAGRIFGSVPYTFLKLHEGNTTWTWDPTAFSCLNYYEFASDKWVTLFYEHNFNGLVFSRIPLIKKLKWREAFTLKATWGDLDKRNDGSLGRLSQAQLLFPEGMRAVKTPYVEIGAGITNIFKVIRLDAVWRLTHRYHEVDGQRVPEGRLFAFNVGFELKF